MKVNHSIFKAYDIRGICPNDINAKVAYRLGQVFAAYIAKSLKQGKGRKKVRIVVAKDNRKTTPKLATAVIKGIQSAGCDVIDIGLSTTPMMYFAVAHYDFDGGLIITASHNPKEYNGAKFVREQSKPISSETGLFAIRDIAINDKEEIASLELTEENLKLVEKKNILNDYIAKVKTFVDLSKLKSLKIRILI
jgi:phosphomannomutase